jgi:catalase
MQEYLLFEKMAQFNRERVHERDSQCCHAEQAP